MNMAKKKKKKRKNKKKKNMKTNKKINFNKGVINKMSMILTTITIITNFMKRKDHKFPSR